MILMVNPALSGHRGAVFMWNDKQITNAIKKNILTSILILLVLFLVDNRSYLFTYLPHRFMYEQREAYVQYGRPRHNYVRVVVMEQDEAIAKGTVKRAPGEKFGSVITVGYSSKRKPSIVRSSLVVTGGQIAVFVAMILGNLRFIWKIHKLTR